MAFHDRVRIEISAGRGGDGSRSFARFAREPLAGPDGGDGGKGGDVWLAADGALDDLSLFAAAPKVKAEPGGKGMPGKKSGKNAPDLTLRVPCGTRVLDAATGAELMALLAPGERMLLLKGGAGGRGNVKFATPTIRTPNKAEPGFPGEARVVEFVYRQPAPVALLEPSSIAAAGHYFRIYSALARNRPDESAFYMRKPRIFYFEREFRRYPVAFLPFHAAGADEAKFPNLAHLYNVHVAVVCLSGMSEQYAAATLDALLDALSEIERPNLRTIIAASPPQPAAAAENFVRMCDNRFAPDGASASLLPLTGDDAADAEAVGAAIAMHGAEFARGD
ncbi:MAG: hypothetical protein HRF49_11470 [bacterium]